MKLRVALNGTDTNPYLPLGVTQNPFPQEGPYEYMPWVLHLQRLGAAPIKDAAQIREHLAGWSEEFVDKCVAEFRPGEYVAFEVEWEDER